MVLQKMFVFLSFFTIGYSLQLPQSDRVSKLRSRNIVINLDRREDRKEHFLSFLGSHAHVGTFTKNWCRMKAFDAHNASALEELVTTGHLTQKSLGDAREHPAKRWTPGIIGCYESHMQAMRIIAADPSVSFGIIAEDDLAFLSPDFKKNWKKLHQPATWKDTDMIYLQSCSKGWRRTKKGTHTAKRDNTHHTKLINVQGKQVYCLGMYAVSRGAAQNLTMKGTPLLPMEIPIDQIIPLGVPSLRAKAFSPPIAQNLGSGDGPASGTDVQRSRKLSLFRKDFLPDCTV